MWSLLKYVVYGVVIVPLDYFIIKGVDKIFDLSSSFMGRGRSRRIPDLTMDTKPDDSDASAGVGILNKIYPPSAAADS